jgi:hypothetical protein
MGPCVRVRSREIGEGLDWGEIAEALEPGSIVVSHKTTEEGVALRMAGEGAACAAPFGFAADGLGDAAVEAFNEAIGLRPIRSGQAVIDVMARADEIEWVLAGRLSRRLVLHIDSKAIGELCAVIGQNGVNRIREVSQEPGEEAGRSLGIALEVDFDIDVAGGAVDRDEGIAFTPLQGRQMLQIEVDEADSRLFKDADAGLVRLLAMADSVALKATMDGTAGELAVHATSHHFDDIVEGQLQRGSQFADQRLFRGRQACRQRLRPV